MSKRIRNYQHHVDKAGGETELLEHLQQKHKPTKPSTNWDDLVEWMKEHQVPFETLGMRRSHAPESAAEHSPGAPPSLA